MNKLSFASAAKAIPDLNKEADSKVEVIIIGYKDCPYSRKALSAADRHPKWGAKQKYVLFVAYDWGATDDFREKSGYAHGSFPVVFVRDPKSRKFEHVGGGTELDQLVK